MKFKTIDWLSVGTSGKYCEFRRLYPVNAKGTERYNFGHLVKTTFLAEFQEKFINHLKEITSLVSSKILACVNNTNSISNSSSRAIDNVYFFSLN